MDFTFLRKENNTQTHTQLTRLILRKKIIKENWKEFVVNQCVK